MNNENFHPNHPHRQTHLHTDNINHKLATLLVIITTFQQKIEILRVKLSGHPNFSPQLYYKQIDRLDKGYIDTQDMITFIKKSKPTFNIDHRYLCSLFNKLNNNDRDNIPKDRLTYFGYLNIIKPYFDNKLARDLLLRDSIAMGTEIDLVVKKLLEDLICTLYACVAQHQRAKQLMILGDIQEGGNNEGTLYNIYQLIDIIKQDSHQTQPISLPIVNTNPNLSLPRSQPNIRSQASISQNIHSSNSLLQKLTYQSTLDIFYKFICKNSQFQVNREDMKYLLAYLMCHEHMITNQKYLTQLFMPVTSKIQIGSNINMGIKIRQNLNKNYFREIQIQSEKILPSQTNFLNYVHPNSMSRETLQLNRKTQQLIPNRSSRDNPQIKIHSAKQLNNKPKLIDQQPRHLINSNNSTMQTPILQKFLRQSKVLKNMSRYKPNQIYQQQSQQQSAFIQQSNYLQAPNPKTANKNPSQYNNNNNLSNNFRHQQIGMQHKPRQVNKDFNLQQVLSNSNLHRSQYYQNLSLRANIKDKPFEQGELRDLHTNRKATNNLQQSGILNQFMRR